jgi:hypothetical protein
MPKKTVAARRIACHCEWFFAAFDVAAFPFFHG